MEVCDTQFSALAVSHSQFSLSFKTGTRRGLAGMAQLPCMKGTEAWSKAAEEVNLPRIF
jgi:hypothetical protein